ncbi:hypothetical protein BDW69DRAFT_121290 [Aspergillus filifer]
MGEIADWSRAQKTQHKQRGIKTPPPRRRCYDWFVISGTCHYAKNRSSFKTYQRVGKTVLDRCHPTYVAGIGRVDLKVRYSPEKGTKTGSISLNNVLHIPNALYNGLNHSLSHSCHRREYRPVHLFCGFDEKGSPIWYAKAYCTLYQMVLLGNPQGESYLSPRGYYAPEMYIDPTQFTKWWTSSLPGPELSALDLKHKLDTVPETQEQTESVSPK